MPYSIRRLYLLRLRGSLRSVRAKSAFKPLLFAVMGTVFLTLETVVFYRVFWFLLQETEGLMKPFALSLSHYLLQLLFLTFGIMLVYSNLITAVSVYLTANDMRLLLRLPLRNRSLYLGKYFETLARSSMTLAVFVLPVLACYGVAREAGAVYYLATPFLLTMFLLIPTSLAIPMMLLLARIFPADRLRQGLVVLGLMLTTGGLFAFRMLRVEEVFSAGSGLEEMMAWSASFNLPSKSWMPSAWLVNALKDLSEGTIRFGDAWSLAVCSAVSCLLSVGVGTPFLRTTWSRSVSAPRKEIGRSPWFRFGGAVPPGLSRSDLAMFLKEIKVFTRDISRWSQIVMMIPLIAFYLLNMYMLPFPDRFAALYYLLNLFMIAFIVAAIGARYLFPSISWEGPALWWVRVSPYPVWRLVFIKFLIFSPPLLALTCLLTVFSFEILDFPREAFSTSLLLSIETTCFLSALAVGFGASLPRFRYEHHLEIALGPGGLLYMLTAFVVSTLFVGLNAYPVFEAMGEDAGFWATWDFSNLVTPSIAVRNYWTLFCFGGGALSLVVGTAALSRREEFDR